MTLIDLTGLSVDEFRWLVPLLWGGAAGLCGSLASRWRAIFSRDRNSLYTHPGSPTGCDLV